MNTKPINLLDWRNVAYKVRLMRCTVIVSTTLALSIIAANLITTYCLISPPELTSKTTPPGSATTACDLDLINQKLQQLKKNVSRQNQRRQQHNQQAQLLSALALQCHPPCQLTELKFSQSKWAIAGIDSNATDIDKLLRRLNKICSNKSHLKQIANRKNHTLSFLIEAAPDVK